MPFTPPLLEQSFTLPSIPRLSSSLLCLVLFSVPSFAAIFNDQVPLLDHITTRQSFNDLPPALQYQGPLDQTYDSSPQLAQKSPSCVWPSMDALFIIDSTLGLSPFDHGQERAFLEGLLSSMAIAPNRSRVSIAQFTPQAKFELSLGATTTRQAAIEAVQRLQLIACDTSSSPRLCQPTASVNSIARFALQEGNRKMIPDVIVVVSSTKWRIPELREREVLMSPTSPIHVFFISVGSSSVPPRRFEPAATSIAFTSIDFSSLVDLVVPLCMAVNDFIGGNSPSSPCTGCPSTGGGTPPPVYQDPPLFYPSPPLESPAPSWDNFSPLAITITVVLSLLFFVVLLGLGLALWQYREENDRLRRRLLDGEKNLRTQNEYFTGRIQKQMEEEMAARTKYEEQLRSTEEKHLHHAERLEQRLERELDKAKVPPPPPPPPAPPPQPIIIPYFNGTRRLHPSALTHPSLPPVTSQLLPSSLSHALPSETLIMGPSTPVDRRPSKASTKNEPRKRSSSLDTEDRRRGNGGRRSSSWDSTRGEGKKKKKKRKASGSEEKLDRPVVILPSGRLVRGGKDEVLTELRDIQNEMETSRRLGRMTDHLRLQNELTRLELGLTGTEKTWKDFLTRRRSSEGTNETSTVGIKDSSSFHHYKGHLPSDHPARILPPIDLLLLVDSSSSIGVVAFENVKKNLELLLEDVDIAPGRSRVGLIQYARQPTVVFGLDKYYSFESVKRALNRMPYTGGATFLAKALNFSAGILYNQQNLKEKKLKALDNAPIPRHDRLQILLLVSDGASEDDVNAATAQLHEQLQVKIGAMVTRSSTRPKLVSVTRYEGAVHLIDNTESINIWLWRQQRLWMDNYEAYLERERTILTARQKKEGKGTKRTGRPPGGKLNLNSSLKTARSIRPLSFL